MKVKTNITLGKKAVEIKCGNGFDDFTITNREHCSFLTIYNKNHKLWIDTPAEAKDIVRGLIYAIKELTGEVYKEKIAPKKKDLGQNKKSMGFDEMP